MTLNVYGSISCTKNKIIHLEENKSNERFGERLWFFTSKVTNQDRTYFSKEVLEMKRTTLVYYLQNEPCGLL